MQLGIVGLPNVGKSTLFKLLTKIPVEISNYPFCTISPNVGVVEVFDERLNNLKKIAKPEKITPAVIEFFDIAGLVKGASKGEGLGNQFLSHIREVDGIIHVVRFFEDSEIVSPNKDINPIRDAEIVNFELLLADLSLVEKRLEKLNKEAKTQDKKILKEKEIVEKIKSELEKGISIRKMDFKEEEKKIIKYYNFLTEKPMLYVANISEKQINSKDLKDFEEWAKKEDISVISLPLKLEEEIANLDKEEQENFRKEYKIENGLQKLLKMSYNLVGLITFFTIYGEKEIRAWSIKKGTKAQEAAGKIHSDIEEGFIKAEVISYENLIKAGDWNLAKEKGLVVSEGKDYIVQDGDVIYFRFKKK
jgi:GTP-binding protein YchF